MRLNERRKVESKLAHNACGDVILHINELNTLLSLERAEGISMLLSCCNRHWLV